MLVFAGLDKDFDFFIEDSVGDIVARYFRNLEKSHHYFNFFCVASLFFKLPYYYLQKFLLSLRTLILPKHFNAGGNHLDSKVFGYNMIFF
jgi:hypothetical protein